MLGYIKVGSYLHRLYRPFYFSSKVLNVYRAWSTCWVNNKNLKSFKKNN